MTTVESARRLAAAVVGQAVHDLAIPSEAPGAAAFLLERLWYDRTLPWGGLVGDLLVRSRVRHEVYTRLRATFAKMPPHEACELRETVAQVVADARRARFGSPESRAS